MSLYLQKKLEQEFQELVRRNDDASIFRCTELLTKLHEPIKTKICTREYLVSGGYQTYELDIDMLRKKYYISKETLGSQVFFSNLFK